MGNGILLFCTSVYLTASLFNLLWHHVQCCLHTVPQRESSARVLLSHLSPTVCTGSPVLRVLFICMRNMTTRAPITTAAGPAAIDYLAYKRFYVKDPCSTSMKTFHNQKNNSSVYYHCWRSKKFTFWIYVSLRNGFHPKHNKNEAGWDPGPCATRPAPGHSSPPAMKSKEISRD